MAVRPEECIKPTSEEEAFIDKLEKEIDIFLRANYVSHGMTVCFPLKVKLNTRVFDAIIKRYNVAGWQCNQTTKGTDHTSFYLDFKQTSKSNGYWGDR